MAGVCRSSGIARGEILQLGRHRGTDRPKPRVKIQFSARAEREKQSDRSRSRAQGTQSKWEGGREWPSYAILQFCLGFHLIHPFNLIDSVCFWFDGSKWSKWFNWNEVHGALLWFGDWGVSGRVLVTNRFFPLTCGSRFKSRNAHFLTRHLRKRRKIKRFSKMSSSQGGYSALSLGKI